jgi:hypothetical protein
MSPSAVEATFKEANAKWALYRSAYLPKLQGFVRGCKSDGTVTFTFEFKNRADSSLYSVDARQPDRHRQEVCAVNPKYTFALSKKKEGDWLLDKYSLDPSQAVGPMGIPRDIEFTRAAEQFTVAFMPLPELVNHASFSIRSMKNLTTAEGLDVVRVEFGFKPHMQKQPMRYLALESGVITFVPSQFWRVLDCDVNEKHADSATHWQATYEVQLTDGSVPLLKRSVVKTRSKLTNGETKSEEFLSECDLQFHEGVSEGEFYLTAFGLPEPIGITPPTSRLYVWLALAALGALGLAALFGTLKRGWQRRAPPK